MRTQTAYEPECACTGPLSPEGADWMRLIAMVLEPGVRLRLVIGGLPESRYAAEQSLEDVARP